MNRRKRHSVLVILLSLVLFIFTVSCNSETPVPSASQMNSASSAPGDNLVYYFINKDYKMSDAQVETALSDTLGLLDDNSSTLTKQSSHDYEMACADGAKGEVGEYSLTFYDYEIQTEGQGVRHALVTDDRRVGPVLCVVDGELDSSMFFMEAFLEAAEKYADSIGDTWSAITDDDVRDFWEKYSGSNEDSKIVSHFILKDYTDKEGYEDTVLPSTWGQMSPFNLAVRIIKEGDFPVGCANLGIAMICSKYDYPVSITNNNMLNSLKGSVLGTWWTGWNGEIDWTSIAELDGSEDGWEVVNDTWHDDVQRSAVGSLSAFLMEVGLRTNSVYATGGTGTSIDGVLNVLEDMGYTMSKGGQSYNGKVYDWSYDNICSSLSLDYPVLCYDMNHMFIVDGMISAKSKLYPVLGWYVADDSLAIPIESQHFVHMNFGWYGNYNGWYNENIVRYSLEIIAAKKDPSDYGYPKVPTSLILNLRPANIN